MINRRPCTCIFRRSASVAACFPIGWPLVNRRRLDRNPNWRAPNHQICNQSMYYQSSRFWSLIPSTFSLAMVSILVYWYSNQRCGHRERSSCVVLYYASGAGLVADFFFFVLLFMFPYFLFPFLFLSLFSLFVLVFSFFSLLISISFSSFFFVFFLFFFVCCCSLLSGFIRSGDDRRHHDRDNDAMISLLN